MAQIQATGITGSLNIIGSVTASSGFFGISAGGGPAVSYITSSNPPGNVNPATSGVLWLNSATNELFTCVANTTNRNDWGGTSGSRLYYGAAASSSLTASIQETSAQFANGIVSTTYGGTSVPLYVNLRDVYGIAVNRVTQPVPTQTVGFTMSNATTATATGTGGPGGFTSSVSTTALSGTVTVSASLDGNVIPNYFSIPVIYPSRPYGLGTSTYAILGSEVAVSTGSGGPAVLRMLTTNPGDTGHVWASASCGQYYCMFLRADGSLWGRGDNSTFQITTTGTAGTLRLVSSSAGPWTKISTGYAHTCAINTRGELYCWGYNQSGQCGNGTSANTITTPTRESTNASNWVEIACGHQYTLALKSNGTLWAWGLNTSYQLGDGTTTLRTSPTQIGSDTNWAKIFPGLITSHAIKTTGTLWGWGNNQYYQIGDGTTTTRTSPTQVGAATDWVTISRNMSPAGGTDYNRLGIRGTTTYRWGYNPYAEIASGSVGGYITSPTLLSIPPAKKITQNQYATYFLDTGSGIFGWTNTLWNNSGYGTFLGYSNGAGGTYDTSTAYNAPPAGEVRRVSSIYSFDHIEASYYSMVAIGRVLTGSGAPSGVPSGFSATVSVGNHIQLNWTSGDRTAETRIQMFSGASLLNTYHIRPAQTSVYITPASVGTYTFRLSHIRNELHSSAGVTSSAVNYCATYGTQISNTCSQGQRTIVYADGACGTYQEQYCDLTCGGYSYNTQICLNQDNCCGGTVYACYDRYTYSGGGPCATIDVLQGDYCSVFYNCCYGC